MERVVVGCDSLRPKMGTRQEGALITGGEERKTDWARRYRKAGRPSVEEPTSMRRKSPEVERGASRDPLRHCDVAEEGEQLVWAPADRQRELRRWD